MSAVRTGRSRALSAGLGALAFAEVTAAVVLSLAADWSWQDALDAFTVTNALMGASFALSGLLVSWHRPANAVGWLLLADGLAHATSAWLPPLVQLLHDDGGPLAVQRLAVTVFLGAWPWAIALFLPMALLLFPDGRLPSPRWRPVAWAVVLTAPLFVVEAVADTTPVRPGFPAGYLSTSSYDALAPLWLLSEIRTMAAIALAVASLVVRYRRGGETQRRQLLWLVLAGIAVVAGVLPWAFVAGTPVVVLFSIPLIPAAITVAVVRHRILDVRVVLSRATAWLLLSVIVLASYGVLVAVLDSLVSRAVGRSVLATVLVAVGAAPLLPRLQRVVDRWMYGDRDDPARVASGIAEKLATGEERGLAGVVEGLRLALRLPYVGLRTRRSGLVDAGEPGDRDVAITLTYAGEEVGELLVGLRPGERSLAAQDRAALALVTAPLAVAVHASDLATDLQESRERIVLAREEERRRLRRDLHDGLGPTLTGMAMGADAAGNVLADDPGTAAGLVGSLRRDARAALAEVRRLVDDLRPGDLDELGLLDALRRRADQLARRPDGSAVTVDVRVPERLPALPAAVEVAAYRIATEALTNVARHARASRAALTLRCGAELEVEVVDDGHRNGWVPGVGLQAMAERAAEVGARFEAGPSGAGGRVYVAIPLGSS
ncbi:MAG: two-component sensor histidine kinase [Nocardioidaceae bacterium]|nr:two-component sensor histidine kinase [Nocardioidaceae bacterium]